MIKKIILFIIILLYPLTIDAEILKLPSLNSEIALVYDLTTDNVLYAKNINIKTPIASLTKIMTTMTALNLISDLDTEVTITKEMLKGIYANASVAGLKEGDKVTYFDLLNASLLPSGADATQSLAISLSKTVPNFVEQMNELAANIGLSNSHFLNTSGLDFNGQYSTASDVLTLLKYALANPIFKEIFTTKEYTLTNGLEVKSTLLGYEKSLEIDTSRIIGSKTGYTDYAGMCLASLTEVANHEIIIITIKAPYIRNTYLNLKDHLAIISFLDANYLVQSPLNVIDDPIIEKENQSKTNNIIGILSIPLIIILIVIASQNKKIFSQN